MMKDISGGRVPVRNWGLLIVVPVCGVLAIFFLIAGLWPAKYVRHSADDTDPPGPAPLVTEAH